ncbi:MAG: hypothetical protein WCD88_14640 [Desulfobacterales bacterium]
MEQVSTLFIQTFTTLLAIINPLEVLPIFLKLMDGPWQSRGPLSAMN